MVWNSCGGGSWLFDMATEFSLPSFTGIDISPVIPQGIKPKNVEFLQRDVLNGLPFQDNSIDYVHQELLVAGVPSDRWQSLINDIVRVLKPGGYLEVLYLKNMKNHLKFNFVKIFEIFDPTYSIFSYWNLM